MQLCANKKGYKRINHHKLRLVNALFFWFSLRIFFLLFTPCILFFECWVWIALSKPALKIHHHILANNFFLLIYMCDKWIDPGEQYILATHILFFRFLFQTFYINLILFKWSGAISIHMICSCLCQWVMQFVNFDFIK